MVFDRGLDTTARSRKIVRRGTPWFSRMYFWSARAARPDSAYAAVDDLEVPMTSTKGCVAPEESTRAFASTFPRIGPSRSIRRRTGSLVAKMAYWEARTLGSGVPGGIGLSNWFPNESRVVLDHSSVCLYLIVPFVPTWTTDNSASPRAMKKPQTTSTQWRLRTCA